MKCNVTLVKSLLDIVYDYELNFHYSLLSPTQDLNPIEMIWPHLKRVIRKHAKPKKLNFTIHHTSKRAWGRTVSWSRTKWDGALELDCFISFVFQISTFTSSTSFKGFGRTCTLSWLSSKHCYQLQQLSGDWTLWGVYWTRKASINLSCKRNQGLLQAAA